MGDFTIQISSNLVNRLADDDDKLKKKNRRTRPKVTKEHRRPQSKEGQSPIQDESVTTKGAAVPGWPPQSPLFLPLTPPAKSADADLEAIRSVLQESEKIVDRVQKQEENMLQEVTQRAKDLRDKEFKLPYQKPEPCLAEKDASMICYKEHLKEPLKCDHFVKKYAECVRQFRQQVKAGSD